MKEIKTIKTTTIVKIETMEDFRSIPNGTVFGDGAKYWNGQVEVKGYEKENDYLLERDYYTTCYKDVPKDYVQTPPAGPHPDDPNKIIPPINRLTDEEPTDGENHVYNIKDFNLWIYLDTTTDVCEKNIDPKEINYKK